MNPTEIREENIPEELKKIPRWICWVPYMENGKLDKIPVAPWLTDGELKTTQEGRPIECSYTDPKTHVSFLEALSYAKKLNIGIGFVLAPELKFVVIDLDDCVEDGKPNLWVESVLAEVKSYAEITPSGKGVRIWLKGSIPQNFKIDDLNVEIYKEKRFLTVTGWWIESTPRRIKDNEEWCHECREFNEYFTGKKLESCEDFEQQFCYSYIEYLLNKKYRIREFDDYILDLECLEFTCKLCNKTNSSCEHFGVRYCEIYEGCDHPCHPNILHGIQRHGQCLIVWRKEKKTRDIQNQDQDAIFDPVKIEGDEP